MDTQHITRLWGLILIGISILSAAAAEAQTAVVRAVLFYSPTCGHCHQVITQDLPPLAEQYGEQLVILAIDASTPQGNSLYKASLTYFEVPPHQRGVPLMLVGDAYLMGSSAIPQELPRIVASGMAEGGIDWPQVPELRAALEAEGLISPQVDAAPAAEAAAESEPAAVEPSLPAVSAELSLAERFAQDRVGNSLAVAVLLSLLALLGWTLLILWRGSRPAYNWPGWLTPLLIILGVGVALYLSTVELTQIEAVCGPIGDCLTVQQSQYATLFGWLPIGVLGVIGYVCLGSAWLLQRYGPPYWGRRAARGLWLLALGGTLFSIYLTFLEPFVIGASCAWCLSSAVIMGLLLWGATEEVLGLKKRKLVH